jgi:tetratricopeptide (TPR) repeat protein
MRNNKLKSTKKIEKKQRVIYNSIIVLFPLILIIFIELVLRIAGYGDDLKLFVKHPDKAYNEYKIVNPEIGKKYFQEFEYSRPPKDIFLKKKTDDVFRIFVMGSSTVAGFPYENNLMFSRILHERLMEAYPHRNIEVVNTAITAINSHTLRDFMPQVLNEKPDAILFYAGHNEFYGAFGAGSNERVSSKPAMLNLHLKLMDYRVYQLIRNVIYKFTAIARNMDTALKKRGTLMARIVKDADIVYASEIYNEGIANYERNLDKMLNLASKNKVPVYISELVSNLLDMEPFGSIATDDYDAAINYYNKAVQDLDDNKIDAAHENFVRARDYDCVRFRASSDINRIVRDKAEKYGAVLVPVLENFEANSPNGIVGDNLLTEHLHPNTTGQFLMAETFYVSLISDSIIDSKVDLFSVKPFNYFVNNYGMTQLDFLLGKHRVENLKYHWPFVSEDAAFVDYRLVYKPTSRLDSLAFNIMALSDANVIDAHLEMAGYYKDRGDFLNAFKEYHALTKINPYWPVYFRNAADCLIQLRDLPGALRFFERSNKYEESFYAHYRAGEIYMMLNNVDEAIINFEKSLSLTSIDNEKLNALNKLYVAYNLQGNSEKSIAVFKQIKKAGQANAPDVPGRTFVLNSFIPLQVHKYITLANEQIAESNYPAAINILLQSINVYDTPVANFKLGDLFYRVKEFEKALFHFQKIYDFYKGDVAYLHFLVVTNLSNRNKQAAENALSELKRIDPDYSGIVRLQKYIDDFS